MRDKDLRENEKQENKIKFNTVGHFSLQHTLGGHFVSNTLF